LNLLAELRRRNVIRMAGLYLVGAWLLIQIAETLLPIFNTPEWVLQALVVLLSLGLLPALVFSWIYELTPDGLKCDVGATTEPSMAATTGKRMDRLILAGLAAVILVVAADRLWPRAELGSESTFASEAEFSGSDSSATVDSDPKPDTAATEPQGARVEPGSIAVLPFVNMSAEAENEYFSDGISEELLNVLVKVEGLSVASRTSSFAYKGREMSAASIGAELKVAHVLEGSVRKAGKRVRITAQLIDADSDRHLWSETYDRELDDIFAIQDEIAKAIVAALRETLGDTLAKAPVSVKADTDNVDAYQLYLQARELFFARHQLDESVHLFEQVVALDPEFARGWEGLAAAAAVIVDWKQSYPSIDESALKARALAAADRALALDPSLSMPWAARSLVVSDGVRPVDFATAIDLLDRAIAADARNATARLWRGILWVGLGFIDRAVDDFEACLAVDPAYSNCKRWKAIGLLFQGRTDAALDLYQQGVIEGFNDNRGNSFVEPLLRRGELFAAVLLMREIGWPREIQEAVIDTVVERNPPDDVAALLSRYPEVLRRKHHLGLVLRDYSVAAEDDEWTSSSIEHWDPAYEGLRTDPAFKHLLQQIGVPAYWRAHGFPPQCRPVGEGDFVCDEPPSGK
jgi:TolB-like protein